MNVKNNITIRKIEEKDKANYLRLFADEDFGCIGINSELKPSLYEEESILEGILNETIISTAVLIIEDNEEFIGYASISRPSEHNYHIGHIAIRKDKRFKGYGRKLLNEIKRCAEEDDCSIDLECINVAINFFEKQGFNNTYSTKFTYPRKKSIKRLLKHKSNLFVDYELIKQKEAEENMRETKSFQKFLESPLFKQIMKL